MAISRIRSESKFWKAARFISVQAAESPLTRRACSKIGDIYVRITQDPGAEIRKQANILRVLPDAWHGLRSYVQTYHTSPLFDRRVTMSHLIDAYDAFFVDIFGTCKDETAFWEGAAGALRAMVRRRKDVVIVSNTADFSVAKTLEQLRDAGVRLEERQVVTSGQLLKNVFTRKGILGEKVLCAGNDVTAEYVRMAGGVPETAISAGRDGHKAIVISLLAEPLPASEEKALGDLVSRNDIPIILANIDMFLPRYSGVVENLAFRLAQNLAKRGNPEVIEIGKPHSEIYEEALTRVVKKPKKILCIGDTLWTDIQGADNIRRLRPDATVDSLLLLSGTERKVHHNSEVFEAYMKSEGIFPTYLLPRFEVVDS